MTREPRIELNADGEAVDAEPVDAGANSSRQPRADDANQALSAVRDSAAQSSLEKPGDPPVVARMVIEIRSDGSRTIARGAIEEVTSGEKIALEAHGTTPMALAANLTKSLLSAPLLAAQMFSRAAENPDRPKLFQAAKAPSDSEPGIRSSAKRAVRALLERRKKQPK